MYEIPNINMDAIIGKFQSLIGVGKYNIQMNFGIVNLSIESSIKIFKKSELVAEWHPGIWPSLEFYNIIDVNVIKYEIIENRALKICFENEHALLLENESDHYECFSINIDGRRYII